MAIRQTHTYAEFELSKAAYDEIATKLLAAGYGHAFEIGAMIEVGKDCGPIDMHGIGVTREK
jgi:hypothetical protein